MDKAKPSGERGAQVRKKQAERANAKNEKIHQKVILPTFENHCIEEAKLWWKRFTQ